MDNDQLNKVLAQGGVSKTIYALVTPEIERITDCIIDGGDVSAALEQELRVLFQEQAAADPTLWATRLRGALSEQRESFRHLYREAWTQKQDAIHNEFFSAWRNWIKPVVTLDEAAFPYLYPTGGASEGLREAIYNYAINAHRAGFSPVIHTFVGEYEGFASYAAGAGVRVIAHNRKNWQEALCKIGPRDQFYISQPSAIDGNVWGEFEEFAKALGEHQPSCDLMLDLTYVGCVARNFSVKADHLNIKSVFFSLSKPAGAYYHRIGGCLSREEYPGLFGNKWFKNLLALEIGTQFMQQYSVQDMPLKYAPVQAQALESASDILGLPLQSADVYLLGTAKPGDNPSDLERYLTRGSAGEELVRVCLTPTMAKLIDPRIDNTVRARPHEKLER
jgi:hypothetical protein